MTCNNPTIPAYHESQPQPLIKVTEKYFELLEGGSINIDDIFHEHIRNTKEFRVETTVSGTIMIPNFYREKPKWKHNVSALRFDDWIRHKQFLIRQNSLHENWSNEKIEDQLRILYNQDLYLDYITIYMADIYNRISNSRIAYLRNIKQSQFGWYNSIQFWPYSFTWRFTNHKDVQKKCLELLIDTIAQKLYVEPIHTQEL